MKLKSVLEYPKWYLPALKYTVIMSFVSIIGDLLFPNLGWSLVLTTTGFVGWVAFYKKEEIFHRRFIEYMEDHEK